MAPLRTLTFQSVDAAARLFGFLADALGWLAGRTRPARLRSLAEHTSDLIAKTPEGSAARPTLTRHLDDLAERLVTAERASLDRQRDASGIVVALVLLGGFGLLTWWAIGFDGWWRWFVVVPSAFLALVGFVGFFTELSGSKPEDKAAGKPRAQ